jgi:hypothetical protein
MTSLRGDIWAGLTTASRRSMMKCPACGEVVDTRVAVNVSAHMRDGEPPVILPDAKKPRPD